MDTDTGGSSEAVPGFQESVQDICRDLDLSEDVVDTAVDLLDEYRDDFKVNDDYLPPAVVHVASRLEDEPRTQKMIVDYLEKDKNLFSSGRDQLKRNVRKAVKKLRKQEGIELSLVRSEEYLQYIVSQLDDIDIDDAVVETAERYCEAVEERDGVARSKVAIAGCSLKAAVEETGDDRMVSHYQLAEVTGMNKNTFENNLDYLRENNLLKH